MLAELVSSKQLAKWPWAHKPCRPGAMGIENEFKRALRMYFLTSDVIGADGFSSGMALGSWGHGRVEDRYVLTAAPRSLGP